MRSPNLPGFVADASLGAARGRYWPAGVPSPGGTGPAVIAQARVGGVGLGGLGGIRYGFWCEVGCNVAYAACTAACASTGPGAGACIVACSLLYQLCSDGC